MVVPGQVFLLSLQLPEHAKRKEQKLSNQVRN